MSSLTKRSYHCSTKSFPKNSHHQNVSSFIFLLTNQVFVLVAIHAEVQGKELHSFFYLLIHELRMNWILSHLMENNSKEEKLCPPNLFLFWTLWMIKQVLATETICEIQKVNSDLYSKHIYETYNKVLSISCILKDVALYFYLLTFHTFLLPESKSTKCCPWLSKLKFFMSVWKKQTFSSLSFISVIRVFITNYPNN